MVTHVYLVATREEANVALEHVREHPRCKDPENWSIGEATYNHKPGYVINYDGEMDPMTRHKWAQLANEWRSIDVLRLWDEDEGDG